DVELLDPRGERLLSSAANPRGYGKIDPGALRAAAGPASGVVGRFHAARDSAWYPTVAPVFFQARLAGYVVFWRRLSGTATPKTQLNQLIGQGGTATIYFGNTAGDVWTDQTAIVPGPPVTLTADTGLMQYTRPGSEGAVLAEARPVRKAPWT